MYDNIEDRPYKMTDGVVELYCPTAYDIYKNSNNS